MLSFRQNFICCGLALAFWLVAALAIHFGPGMLTGPQLGTIVFVAALPIGWLSVRLTRRAAGLQTAQIPSACVIILAVTASIDGVVLRFLPAVYAADERTCRLAAALLLWGYGASAFAACVMALRPGGNALSHGR
jgi:hypothetical protein